jgi:Viral BACON domain
LSACLGTLAACGGGGGGSGSSVPPGSFTLGTTNVSFSGKYLGPVPASQTLTLHITSAGAAAAGAAYANGESPASWLTVTSPPAGAGPDFTFTLAINTTFLPPAATYTTVLTFGTADANGKILQTQPVQISYSLKEGILISQTSESTSLVVGDSFSSEPLPFTVNSPSTIQWTATSNMPWLTAPSGTQSGGGIFSVTINMAGYPAGTYTGTITLTNSADPTDTATLPVTITMAPPTLTAAPTSITLGGTTGLDTSGQTLSFSIDTNQNAFAWTATPTTSSGGSWLSVGTSSGTVSGASTSITVNADRSLLAAGTYQGQIQLQVTVNGSVVTQNVPVTLNVDPNRLVANATGVAFSSFPSRAVLTRSLSVANTWGATGIHWQTQSDQSWLTATASGTTGSPLVLTADPTTLSPGQYTAHLTISSPDTGVSNQEIVRVGITVGSADPVPLITTSSATSIYTPAIVTSPVEPVAFVTSGATNSPIYVYDLNTGTLLNTFTSGFTTPGSLAISGDGLTLYVVDGAAIRALDALTGTLQGSYPFPSPGSSLAIDGTAPQIAYARPDGHPVLFCPGIAFDLATHTIYPINTPLGLVGLDITMAVSPDQTTLYEMILGHTPAVFGAYNIVYSTLPGVGLSTTQVALNTGGAAGAPLNGNEIALSPDGTTVYIASGAPPDEFDVFNTVLVSQAPLLATGASPMSIATSWNGLIAGGSLGPNTNGDIWIYDSQGNLLEQTDPDPNGNYGVNARGLKFSGDGSRARRRQGCGYKPYRRREAAANLIQRVPQLGDQVVHVLDAH